MGPVGRRAAVSVAYAGLGALYLSLSTFPEFAHGRVVVMSESGSTEQRGIAPIGASPVLGGLLLLGALLMVAAAIGVARVRPGLVRRAVAGAVLCGLPAFPGVAVVCLVVGYVGYRATGGRQRQ